MHVVPADAPIGVAETKSARARGARMKLAPSLAQCPWFAGTFTAACSVVVLLLASVVEYWIV